MRGPWTLNLSPGRPEYTCSAVKMTSRSNVGDDMNKSRRVRLNGSHYTCLLYGALFFATMEYLARTGFKTITCAQVWLCNKNSELATLHCEKTGPGKIIQIFIISRGPILVKCPSVSDSLSAGSASGDNSDMNTRFNQWCISLGIKVWNVITTVKTYLLFMLFFGKWMTELRNFNRTTVQRYNRVQPVTLHAVDVLLSRDTS